MKNIHVGISLTDGDNLTWEEGKRPGSRMMTHGWTDSDEMEKALGSRANKERWGAGGYGWAAQTRVADLEADQPLPETLFVVVYASGAYQKQGTLRWSYGSSHGSWGGAVRVRRSGEG